MARLEHLNCGEKCNVFVLNCANACSTPTEPGLLRVFSEDCGAAAPFGPIHSWD